MLYSNCTLFAEVNCVTVSQRHKGLKRLLPPHFSGVEKREYAACFKFDSSSKCSAIPVTVPQTKVC